MRGAGLGFAELAVTCQRALPSFGCVRKLGETIALDQFRSTHMDS